MRLWTAHYVVLKEAAQKLEYSRKSVRESITRSQAFDVRKNPKRLENVNITKKTEVLGIYYQGLVFYTVENAPVRQWKDSRAGSFL